MEVKRTPPKVWPAWNSVTSATLAICLLSLPQMVSAEESGLITKRSKYSAPETIKRFETAIQDKGYVIFTEIDHAAAAAKFGLQSLPRTVVVYGDPKNGTARLQQFPTLAIDAPPKALVWQDAQGTVWLTLNSAEYWVDHVYKRHGTSAGADFVKKLQKDLEEVSDTATQ
jgi:uncharacterized protein (DUF302 family)